ncbi:MAG TPA: LPS assembly lipoprotein LptE [Rhizomicrobium sp.]|nr:LPS assembly lipoprotein LptE [Rhizomicrobium sp.]
MRRLAALVLSLSLSGCGFHPLYGDSGATAESADKLQAIYVEPIPEKLGYELRNTLIDLFDASGKPSASAYRLRVVLTTKSEGIAIQNDAAITRYNDTLNVAYELTDATTGKVVTKGIELGLSAYNVVASPYATLVAQQDADKRAAEDIAYRIRTDLAVYFAQEAKAARAPTR